MTKDLHDTTEDRWQSQDIKEAEKMMKALYAQSLLKVSTRRHGLKILESKQRF